jgi:hypothetical protein
MPDPFSVRGEKITRNLTKTGHDIATIKPTLQQHNNPQLDPPCPSVLAWFLQRDENRLTSINLKVSNLIHNQRTILASKCYKIGSSSQPVDNLNKILKLSIYTQNNTPLPRVLPSHYNQRFASASYYVKLNLHPFVRSELRLAWVLQENMPIGVPRVDSSIPKAVPSMPSIYGVSRGFNHHLYFH